MSALRASTRRRCPGCNLPGVSLYNINSRTTHSRASSLQPHLKSAQLRSSLMTDYPWRCLCFGFSQMILMLPFLLITLHFSQIGFTEDLTFMMNPPFFAPSAPCRGIFCCKLLECVFFLWVRKKSTRKSSFYSIAFCSRKCKKFFTYFFIFFCSFSVHFFISPTGKKKNRRDRFLFSVPPVFYR